MFRSYWSQVAYFLVPSSLEKGDNDDTCITVLLSMSYYDSKIEPNFYQ